MEYISSSCASRTKKLKCVYWKFYSHGWTYLSLLFKEILKENTKTMYTHQIQKMNRGTFFCLSSKVRWKLFCPLSFVLKEWMEHFRHFSYLHAINFIFLYTLLQEANENLYLPFESSESLHSIINLCQSNSSTNTPRGDNPWA